jgi:Lhr-like helicase
MVPMIGASSDLGKDVMKMIQMIAKHVQPGEVTPAAEKNSIDKMSIQNKQNMQMQQQLRAQQAGAGGGAGGAPGAQAAAA